MKYLLLICIVLSCIVLTSVKRSDPIVPCSKIIIIKSYLNGKLVNTFNCSGQYFTKTEQPIRYTNLKTGKVFKYDSATYEMYEGKALPPLSLIPYIPKPSPIPSDTPRVYRKFIRIDLPDPISFYRYGFIVDSLMDNYGVEMSGTPLNNSKKFFRAWQELIFSNSKLDSVLIQKPKGGKP